MNKNAKTGGKKNSGRIKLPDKTTINLVGIGEKPIKVSIAIPAIILIVIAAAALSKFGVIDRYAAMSAAQSRAAAVQAELDDCYDRMESFGELSDQYAHYTYSDMTTEELSRADRVAAVDLIDRVIRPTVEVGAWSLSGNQLSVTVTGQTLRQINTLMLRLQDEPLVNYTTVTTASTNETVRPIKDDDGKEIDVESLVSVTSNVTIYLNSPEEVSQE